MPTLLSNPHTAPFIDQLTSGLTDNDHIFLVELDQGKNFVSQQVLPPQGLSTLLSGVAFDPTHHYYISANTFRAGGKRTTADLQSLNAIVADIDCHSGTIPAAHRNFRLDYLTHLLKHDLADDILPLPNIIVRSGRGLQVWWLLHPVAADEDAVRRWKQAAASIANTLSHALSSGNFNLDDMYTLRGLDVDIHASTQPNGDYRLPGSTNPNTGTVVKAEVLSPERRSIHEFDSLPSLPAPTQAPAARRTPAKNQNIVKWSEHMLKQVESLRQCRGAIVGDELRNNFCFVYLCLLKNLPTTDEEIKQHLWKFNQGFVCPMSKAELRSSLTTPWKKHYRLSTARIIELLEINDTEAATIGLKTDQSLPDLGAARRQRNEEIIRLAQQGAKVKDIAVQLSISENTVRKVIKTNKIPSRKELIVRLHQQGLTNAEIAQRAKCTVRNVQLALKNEKKSNFPHNNGGDYLGSKDAMAPIGKAPAPAQKLSPALELLRKELYSRYGQNLTEAEFMPYFSIALQKLYEAPTEEQIKAWFSAPLSPGQDKMYRILLELN